MLGIYTGTRAGAIASASPYAEPGRSYVDLERGIFYRKPIGKRATKKRQTPAPIPPRLLAHLRRWRDRKLIATCFVEFNGKPVKSVKRGFKRAVELAGLTGKVTPHTLRHTAATWLMQRGVPIWEAAAFVGMSPDVLQDTYGHHHPDDLQGAAAAIGQKGRFVSVVQTVVGLTGSRNTTKKPNDFWSERQDLILRPLRPEPSAHFLSYWFFLTRQGFPPRFVHGRFTQFVAISLRRFPTRTRSLAPRFSVADAFGELLDLPTRRHLPKRVTSRERRATPTLQQAASASRAVGVRVTGALE